MLPTQLKDTIGRELSDVQVEIPVGITRVGARLYLWRGIARASENATVKSRVNDSWGIYQQSQGSRYVRYGWAEPLHATVTATPAASSDRSESAADSVRANGTRSSGRWFQCTPRRRKTSQHS